MLALGLYAMLGYSGLPLWAPPAHAAELALPLLSEPLSRPALEQQAKRIAVAREAARDAAREQLIGLIESGEATAAMNAALILTELSPSYDGVASIDINWVRPHLRGSRKVSFTEDARTIYARFEKEPDTPLGAALDELLMSGSGMIFSFASTPIQREGRQFDVGAIREGYRRIAVLEHTATNFPKSRFVELADLQIGNLFFEMYLFDHRHDVEHLKNAEKVYASEFRQQLEDLQEGKRLFDDVGLRLSLVKFLLGDPEAAMDTLDEVAAALAPDDGALRDQVYVSAHFPSLSANKSTIFNSRRLLAHQRDVIEKHDGFAVPASHDGPIEELVADIIADMDAFENSDYRIIFASLRSREEAERERDRFQKKLEASGLSWTLEVTHSRGSRWFGIATADEFTAEEAEAARRKMIEAGLPGEAYLWRPRTL